MIRIKVTPSAPYPDDWVRRVCLKEGMTIESEALDGTLTGTIPEDRLEGLRKHGYVLRVEAI